MKKSKWLKWKIGFVGAIGLTILFHEVKISAAFEKAFMNAANYQSTTDISKLQDPVMDDFTSSANQTERSSAPSNRKSQTKTGRS